MLDSLAVVDTRVGLGQTPDEQALVCTEHPVIELDLKKDTECKLRAIRITVVCLHTEHKTSVLSFYALEVCHITHA